MDWTRQIGSIYDDWSWTQAGNSVSADGNGFVYASGSTDGSIGGPNAGGSDGFLARYDGSGTLLWTAQFGTAAGDAAHGASADGLGNIFAVGWTQGALGGPNAGDTDSFLLKYDSAGALQWSRQVGTATDDRAFGVAADGLGNVYFAGWTFGALAGPLVGVQNAFLFKYDSAGNQLWSRQLGVSPTIAGYAVASDTAGNAYLTGLTWGNLAAPPAGFGDVFVTKYDPAGNLQWNAQLGSAVHEEGNAVAADALGNVYVTGYTNGDLAGTNAGSQDAFLLKYNSAGSLQWARQFGTAGADQGDGLAIDSAGNILVSGVTTGNLFGANLGGTDLFLAMFDPAGNLASGSQLGAPGGASNNSIAFDPSSGAIYASGITSGNFGGNNAGGWDVYLVKLEVPEPAGGAMWLVALAAALLSKRLLIRARPMSRFRFSVVRI
ncbi:MAG: SBBP repeat-containing protein [Pirellulales bacterium]|nr:SBBP repeat-containing protein [Pirellulales bacterium]